MHHGTIPPSASLVHEAILHSFRDGKKKKKEGERERETMRRASRNLPVHECQTRMLRRLDTMKI